MDPEVSFGAWVTRRRKALDLTRADLAGQVGCSVSGLRKIESDERRPSREIAELLAEHLHIPPEQRSMFLQVARGQLRVERLSAPLPVSAPVRSMPASSQPGLNLPTPPTPFVGREPELETLAGLLGDGQCRLLTLMGPGGIGKTRLALEAAARHQDLFPDGAWFVSLAALNSSAFLVPAIADALGCVFQGQVEPRSQLLNYLCARQALVVLDNVEHLLDGVGLFTDILERAPGVKLLVTSRERLNLHSEWVFEMQGLPVPASDQAASAEEYSSMVLFMQNARRARAGFELRAEEQPSVVRICQIMEGMPLGIELAAAWVSVLSCGEIAQEIERSLDFLATGARDVPERQRSLRAAFEHSWRLVAADERGVLSRLAIFQGGFTREAAEQVAGASLAALLALVSKSLVRRTESGRYDLHEVVRQYALAHLAEDAPGEAATRDRHCDYYLGLLRDREPALKSADQRETLRELTDEIDNLRAAWDWAVKRGKFVLLGQALRSFGFLFDIRGWLREGIEQLELIVQALRTETEVEERKKVLGQALAQQGLLSQFQGEHDRAQALFEQSLDILRPIGDPALVPDPLIFYGFAMSLCGEFDRAQSLTDEGLACAQAAGDVWFAARGLFDQGFIAGMQGRYAEAYEQMNAGLALWRALGDLRSSALGLNFLSPIVIKLGRYEEARAFLQESLSLCTQLGDRWGMGTAYRHLGLAILTQGDIAEAQSLLHKSLALFTELGMRWDIARSLIYLGEVAAAAGDSREARRFFLESFPLAMETRAIPLALDALIGLAFLQAQAGEAELAMKSSIYVLHHTASTQEAKDRAEHLRAQLESKLAPQQIEAVQARSQIQSLDALVAELLAAELKEAKTLPLELSSP